jgi:hypothetical protein
MNENLKSALRLAQLGFRVYPVWGIGAGNKCLCGGLPDCRPGKHPWGLKAPHGEKQATRDEATICTWFAGPGVNVGVSVDRFCVLDVELAGMQPLAEWEREHGPMPPTPTAKSGSGARHFYFLQHPDVVKAKPKEKVKFTPERSC